jgi:hypothetical protein
MSEINVISRTQILYVDPVSGTVSVINAGPPGPPAGPPSYVICTSTTRPAVPYDGLTIYQTDTDHMLIYEGTVWVPITPEPWINVTAFTNSWVAFDAVTHAKPRYRKMSRDLVQIEGLVKNGTLGQSVFTLPTGYRPPRIFISMNTTGDGKQVRYDVNPDGTVVPNVGGAGSNVYSSLGIIFSTTS